MCRVILKSLRLDEKALRDVKKYWIPCSGIVLKGGKVQKDLKSVRVQIVNSLIGFPLEK